MAAKKPPTLADLVSDLRSQGEPIGSLDEFDMVPFGLSTGNIALDALTGVSGYPAGRITEQFGAPSSGKTTSALQAIAMAQALGKKCAFWDFERSLDETYCRNLGVDVNDLIYMQPNSFEHGANTLRPLIATGELALFVVDSVATMVTENELAADTGKANVADRAKAMHQFLRQIVGSLHNTNCAAIFLNHVMDKVDTSPMGQKLAARGIKRQTTPGGMALPFYASLRIEFRQAGNVRSSEIDLLSGQKTDQIRQQNVQATVVKNKVGDPFGQALLRVRWGKGFSNEYSVYKILKDYAVIHSDKQGKHTFSSLIGFDPTVAKQVITQGLRGNDWIKGEDNVLKVMEADDALYAKCRDIADQILKADGPEKLSDEEQAQLDGEGLGKDEGAVVLSILESEGLSVDTETGELV